jgi:hypothetical protein
MIGEGAKPEVKAVQDTYQAMFERLGLVGRLFRMAEEIGGERLLNRGQEIRTYAIGREARAFSFSDVPLGGMHELLLAVGSPATGFYQVPIIKMAEGIDVVVSGKIDNKGKAEKFADQKRLSDYLGETRGIDDLSSARKVWGVALVPKSAILGDEFVVAGRSTSYGGRIYLMGVNGFMLERGIVAGSEGLSPIMFPDAEGNERYLKLGDILGDAAVAKAEKRGVYPGITVVAGRFERSFPRTDVLYSAGFADERGPMTLGMKGGATLGAGRVGVEVGSESDIHYTTVQGRVTGIDGVMALYLIGVTDKTKVSDVKRELDKMKPQAS